MAEALGKQLAMEKETSHACNCHAKLSRLRASLIAVVALIAPSALCDTAFGREISGQVFIVTKGGESIKLGLVKIDAFETAVVKASAKEADEKASGEREALKQVNEAAESVREAAQKQDANDRKFINEITYEARDLAEKTARRLAYLSSTLFYSDKLPAPLASTKTDADGKFVIEVPDDKSISLIANSHRLAGDSYEFYDWVVSVPPNTQRVDLSNDNLSATGPASDAAVLGRSYTTQQLAAQAHQLADKVRPKRQLKPKEKSVGATDESSQFVTVTSATEVTVRYGKTVLPRGTKLKLLRRDGERIFASFNGETISILASATDVR